MQSWGSSEHKEWSAMTKINPFKGKKKPAYQNNDKGP